MQKTLLTTNDIQIEVEDIVLLEHVAVSIQNHDCIGLIGKNGSGKSTLLKTLAGKVQPKNGSVFFHGSILYIPQFDYDLLHLDTPLYAYIERYYEEWWNVMQVMENTFNMHSKEEQLIKTLSGGELVKIHLAIATLVSPDILLLDEPTNHLDLASIAELVLFLQTFSGACVIVSHNPVFLKKTVTKIWEIENYTIKIWENTYEQYKKQKELLYLAKKRQYEVKKKEIVKVQESMKKEAIRAARSKRAGREYAFGRTTDRFSTGFFGNKASASAGDNKQKLTSLLTQKKEEKEQLKETYNKQAYVSMQTEKKGKKTLVRIENGMLHIQDMLLIDGINMTIGYGDRVVLAGNNGSGKTSLIKGIFEKDKNVSLTGNIYTASDLHYMYLSQKYEVVNPDKTIIENMFLLNPNASYEDIRKQLANFLFFEQSDLEKSAKLLSGGEIARLAFAMLTMSAIDLLILDEPTNNLDIETKEAIATALQLFQGSILIISHDIAFLQDIGIDFVYTINAQKKTLLLDTNNMP